MNVNLTPELERLVQDKIATGLYNNQSEVVREALRLYFEQESLRSARLDQLRAAVADGLAQADRGEVLAGASVVAEARQRLLRGAGTTAPSKRSKLTKKRASSKR